MRMMQDSGGGKYNTPTAKGLDRIWKTRTQVKQFITQHEVIIPSIRREARAAP